METFLIIFCVILISLTLIMMNIAIYKTIIDSVDNIPKWLNRVLLIPPFSFVGILNNIKYNKKYSRLAIHLIEGSFAC